MDIPNRIKEFLSEMHKNSDSPCSQCNSNCCNGPGFAILENVIEIYKKYISQSLIRSDYSFDKGLSLSQFIFKYFDRTILNQKLLIFFPKMLTENSELISVPPWNFWIARDYLKKRNQSFGCIFLNRKQYPSDFSHNKCILHNTNAMTHVSEKPIDCILLTCNGIKNIIKPSETESAMWFALLDYSFPSSVERFKQLCPDIVE